MLKIVAGLSLLATSVACAQLIRSTNMPPDGVVVTRLALTVSVPLDTSAAATMGAKSTSEWDLRIDLVPINHSTRLWLTFGKPLTVPTYRAPLNPESCRALMVAYSCRDSATAQIENGRLVVVVRDSAMLALLFDGRPTSVLISSSLPRLPLPRQAVRYVDPQILPPSKAARAEYDLALGREGWSPWTRTLWVGKSWASDTVWMQVGDRLTVGVREEQVQPIDARNERLDFTASDWVSSDSSVVTIAPANSPLHSVNVAALRPGRSTVAVNGLRGASDELPRSPRARTLTRTFIVTPRLARVEIVTRLEEIVAGSKVTLVARVIDERGRVVAGAPVGFYVLYDPPGKYGPEGSGEDPDLTTPGQRRFIAYFETLADTLDVRFVPGRTPRH
jgi:hypothetical protein